MRFRVLTYSELSKEIEQLSYRDKFRLAQLLIQLARKEEEEQNPEQRQKRGPSARLDINRDFGFPEPLRKTLEKKSSQTKPEHFA